MWTVIVDIKNRERGIDKVEAAAGAQAAQDRHADDVPNHDHAAERMQQDPGAGAAAGAQAGQDRHGIQLLQDVCAVCGVEVTGKSQCSGCHSVNYCSREHQKEHRTVKVNKSIQSGKMKQYKYELRYYSLWRKDNLIQSDILLSVKCDQMPFELS